MSSPCVLCVIFCTFCVKKLPPGTIVARKFGERGLNGSMEFSESAIIYRANEPYLLTIMTSGSNIKDQTSLVSELSGLVYQRSGND